MANYYFFADIDLLDTQNLQDNFAFGPDTSNAQLNYRVTSLHTSQIGNNNPQECNAYAVTDGLVFVQEDPNNSHLVNLILSPPPQGQPYGTIPGIKYFVYRGILKSSLYSGTGNYELTTPTKSDLASALILARSEMIAEGVNPDITTRTLLGAHLQHGPGGDFDDEYPIERAFSWTGTNFTPFPILAGESIGKFNTDAQTVVNHGGGTVNSRFGFEIILDRSGWQAPLAVARATINEITVVAIPGAPVVNQANIANFQHWHDKEAILNYLDPCAFFGNFVNLFEHTLKVKSSSGATNTYDDNSRARQDIYTDVLSKYVNKNTVYLDIRNELNFSWNYDNKYSPSSKTAVDKTGELRMYYSVSGNEIMSIEDSYNSGGWPIFRIVNKYVAGQVLPDHTIKDHVGLSIAFPVTGNEEPSIHYTFGEFTLLPFSDDGADRFKYLAIDAQQGWTTDRAVLRVPAFYNGGGNLQPNIPICSYFQLHYLKPVEVLSGATVFPAPTQVPAMTAIRDEAILPTEYLDHLFLPVEMILDRPRSAGLQSRVSMDRTYMHATNLGTGPYMANTGIAIDSANNVTFFAFKGSGKWAAPNRGENGDSFVSISGLEGLDVHGSQSFFEYLAQKNNSNLVPVGHNSLSISPTELTTPMVIETFGWGDFSGGSNGGWVQKINGFDAVKLHAEAFAAIQYTYENSFGNSPQAGFTPVIGTSAFLGFEYIDTADSNGMVYRRYRLFLRGWGYDGSGVVSAQEIAVSKAGTNGNLYGDAMYAYLPDTPPPPAPTAPLSLGLGYCVQHDGSANNNYKIKSTIFLQQDGSLTRPQFLNYMSFFAQNVDQIYNSRPQAVPTAPGLNVNYFINKGLPDKLDAPIPDSVFDPFLIPLPNGKSPDSGLNAILNLAASNYKFPSNLTGSVPNFARAMWKVLIDRGYIYMIRDCTGAQTGYARLTGLFHYEADTIYTGPLLQRVEEADYDSILLGPRIDRDSTTIEWLEVVNYGFSLTSQNNRSAVWTILKNWVFSKLSEYLDAITNVTFDTSELLVQEAPARASTTLLDRENLFTVRFGTQNDNAGGRQGNMFYKSDPLPGERYNADLNTPAHEFGHIMGLADRIVYLGQVFHTSNSAPNQNSNDREKYTVYHPSLGHTLNHGLNLTQAMPANFPSGFRGGRAMYLPDHWDIQYATQYRWTYNLMSHAIDVGVEGMDPNPLVTGVNATDYPDAFHPGRISQRSNAANQQPNVNYESPSFKAFYRGANEKGPESPLAGIAPPFYQRKTCFISKVQMQFIMDHQDEKAFDNLIYGIDNGEHPDDVPKAQNSDLMSQPVFFRLDENQNNFPGWFPFWGSFIGIHRAWILGPNSQGNTQLVKDHKIVSDDRYFEYFIDNPNIGGGNTYPNPGFFVANDYDHRMSHRIKYRVNIGDTIGSDFIGQPSTLDNRGKFLAYFNPFSLVGGLPSIDSGSWTIADLTYGARNRRRAIADARNALVAAARTEEGGGGGGMTGLLMPGSGWPEMPLWINLQADPSCPGAENLDPERVNSLDANFRDPDHPVAFNWICPPPPGSNVPLNNRAQEGHFLPVGASDDFGHIKNWRLQVQGQDEIWRAETYGDDSESRSQGFANVGEGNIISNKHTRVQSQSTSAHLGVLPKRLEISIWDFFAYNELTTDPQMMTGPATPNQNAYVQRTVKTSSGSIPVTVWWEYYFNREAIIQIIQDGDY